MIKRGQSHGQMLNSLYLDFKETKEKQFSISFFYYRYLIGDIPEHFYLFYRDTDKQEIIASSIDNIQL